MTNAELAQPEVELQLDKPRKFCIDFNALCVLEKITGRNALFDTTIWIKPDLNILRAIIFAGLTGNDPELTLHEVGKIMTNHPSVIQSAMQAATQMIQAIIDGQKKSNP